MSENNLITKKDLQNAVAELTKLIQETATATEAKILTEVDRRFAALQNDSTNHKQRAKQRPLREKLRKTSQYFDDSFERVWPPEFYQLTQKKRPHTSQRLGENRTSVSPVTWSDVKIRCRRS